MKMQEQKEIYTLFKYETFHEDNHFARIVIEQHGKFFDGRNTWGSLPLEMMSLYASLAISPVHSLLPTVAYRCRLHCFHWPGEYSEDIFLKETTYPVPLYSCLSFLNNQPMVEHRITHDEYTDVILAGADPGTIQWQYRGAWTEKEMLPLDALFHRFIHPFVNNTWIVEKHATLYIAYQIKDVLTPYEGWMSEDTEHPKAKTPEALANYLEQVTFSKRVEVNYERK